MKDLKAVMNQMQSNMQQTHIDNQQSELLKKQVSDNAKYVIDNLFIELKSCYPAWKQAFENKESWLSAKKTWTKAFIENGISNQHQVSIGLVEARKGTNPFWPSAGQFISWCDGPQIDTDEAFNRMISRKRCQCIAEFETRTECSTRCRKELPEDKARALFKKVFLRHLQRVKDGSLVERDFNPAQIVSPEVFRETETPEQRNVRLDAQIIEMLAAGTPLRGPFKKRHLETKGK